MGALGGAIGLGALSAAGTILKSEQQRREQLAQASALDSQAAATYQYADMMKEKNDVEARRIASRKTALTRQFNSIMGKNTVDLAVGNVDASSGSALQVAAGNVDLYANDVGENAYEVALKKWEGEQQRKALQYQAATYDAQSSYLEQTSGNLFNSLLMGGMAGLGGFAMGGGFGAIGGGK